MNKVGTMFNINKYSILYGKYGTILFYSFYYCTPEYNNKKNKIK